MIWTISLAKSSTKVSLRQILLTPDVKASRIQAQEARQLLSQKKNVKMLSVMLNCSPIVSLYSSRRKSRHGRRLKRRGSELQRFSSSNSATMRKWRTKWRKWITTRWCRRRHNNAFYRCERIAASRKLRFSSPYWWASMKRRVRPSWKRNKIMLASNSSSSICNAWTKSGRAELNSMKRSLSRKRKRPEAAKLQKQEPPSLGRLRKSNA